MATNWTKEDLDKVKEFKKNLDAGVEAVGFKTPEEFIKSLGKVASS